MHFMYMKRHIYWETLHTSKNFLNLARTISVNVIKYFFSTGSVTNCQARILSKAVSQFAARGRWQTRSMTSTSSRKRIFMGIQFVTRDCDRNSQYILVRFSILYCGLRHRKLILLPAWLNLLKRGLPPRITVEFLQWFFSFH